MKKIHSKKKKKTCTEVEKKRLQELNRKKWNSVGNTKSSSKLNKLKGNLKIRKNDKNRKKYLIRISVTHIV